jgi:ketosteroid isomerase-like protein
MPTPTAVAQRLYDALAHADGEALFGLLTKDFVGTVSRGMPHGVGGEHRGAADMITGVWARIASVYDMHVDPLDYLQVDDERVVVLGRYWGLPATAVRPSMPRSPTSSPHAVTDRGVATDHRHREMGYPAGVLTRSTDQRHIRRRYR